MRMVRRARLEKVSSHVASMTAEEVESTSASAEPTSELCKRVGKVTGVHTAYTPASASVL